MLSSNCGCRLPWTVLIRFRHLAVKCKCVVESPCSWPIAWSGPRLRLPLPFPSAFPPGREPDWKVRRGGERERDRGRPDGGASRLGAAGRPRQLPESLESCCSSSRSSAALDGAGQPLSGSVPPRPAPRMAFIIPHLLSRPVQSSPYQMPQD